MLSIGIGLDSAALASKTSKFVLDPLAENLFAVFSFQLLTSRATSPCIRVRRSSDNTLKDIGFFGGWIDVASLQDFVGSGSAYIVTFYDQSGWGRHFTQLTAAAQPRIVSSGVLDTCGGQPADRYGSSSGVGYIASGMALAQPYTIINTWMAAGAAPSSEHTLLGRESSGSSYIFAPSSQVRVQAGTQVIPTGFTIGSPQSFGFVFNGATSRAVVNGVSGGPYNVGTDGLTNSLYLGFNSSVPARVLNGYMPDLIILSGAIADKDIISIQRTIGTPRGIIIT